MASGALRQIPRFLAQRCTARLPVRSVAVLSNPKWCLTVQAEKVNVFCKSELLNQKSLTLTTSRFMSSDELSPEKVAERVMSCLRLYDKIKPELLTAESHFMKDLGLDSLDHVEIIVAIENEFVLEIPDDAAETLLTPNDIVKYICECAEATPS